MIDDIDVSRILVQSGLHVLAVVYDFVASRETHTCRHIEGLSGESTICNALDECTNMNEEHMNDMERKVADLLVLIGEKVDHDGRGIIDAHQIHKVGDLFLYKNNTNNHFYIPLESKP